MQKQRIVVSSVALVAIVLTGYLFATRNSLEVRDQSSQPAREPLVQEDPAEQRDRWVPGYTSGRVPDAASQAAGDVVDCMTQSQLETSPMLAEELARFDSFVTSGPTIESYRGLSSAELAGLADQGDSAAMAVLGAMSVMSAMELPEEQAVPFLLLEGPRLQALSPAKPFDPETARHLEKANAWFYKAAVHGRLLALRNVGAITGRTGSKPWELGWISQGEYDDLEVFERHALDPANVYGALAFEIAPELAGGPLGETIAHLTPGGDRQQLVLHELAWQFHEDRRTAGLPPVDIPESKAPSLEELEALLCVP